MRRALLLLFAAGFTWFAGLPAPAQPPEPSSIGGAAEGEMERRVDRVLVVYNRDWVRDLDGSAPGQDSEEIARYYVEARSDPATGRKPWILGLTAGGGARSPLNQSVLRGRSRDNEFGLVRADGSALPKLSKGEVPLSSRHGDAVVPWGRIVAARAPDGLVGFFLAEADLARATRVELRAVREDGQTMLLGAVGGPPSPPHPSVTMLRRAAGGYFLANRPQLPDGTTRLGLVAGRPASEPLVYELPAAPAPAPPGPWRPAKGEAAPVLPVPEASGPLAVNLGFLHIFGATGGPEMPGLLLSADEAARLDSDSLSIAVAPAGRAGAATTILDLPAGAIDPASALWRLDDGSLFFSTSLARIHAGPVTARWSGRTVGGEAFTRERRYEDPADLRLSATGPDGVLDDAEVRDFIESPIRAFLAEIETDDGIPLAEHVRYIVVAHGLPRQVPCLYGIERGVVNARRDDVGAGSALESRLMTLAWTLPPPEGPPSLLAGREGNLARPFLAHPLRVGLLGPAVNRYVHPLTHRREEREAALAADGVEAVRKRAGPPLDAARWAEIGGELRLYAVTRIDGFSMEEMKARIDGARWAERHLVPDLGPVRYGKTNEGQATAKALAARGFATEPIEGPADRALFWFGVFSSGETFAEEVKPNSDEHPVWRRGFLPGSVGWAHRSFLGWSHRDPPGEGGKLFEQGLRAGLTVTAGSAGGAHDTNLTWPDSFVFAQLLLDGYEMGEALLRSLFYVDWTLSVVGDPLYRVDLAATTPDRTPPRVAGPEGIEIRILSAGAAEFFLEVQAKLLADEPEMAEIRATATPVQEGGAPAAGENTLHSARPRVLVGPLRPETEYEIAVALVDPAGNRFATSEAFETPLRITTPPAGPPVPPLFERKFPRWDGEVTIRLPAGLEAAGEVEIAFEGGRGLPEIPGLLDDKGVLSVGGAATIAAPLEKALEDGSAARLRLRWRREPLTREVLLVDDEGREHVVSSSNRLPWDPAAAFVDREITIRSKARVLEAVVRPDPPAAPPSRRGLPRPFDPAAFRHR